MNREEAVKRAERVVTPVIPVTDERHKFLTQLVAMELMGVAIECGWQRETVARLSTICETIAKVKMSDVNSQMRGGRIDD